MHRLCVQRGCGAALVLPRPSLSRIYIVHLSTPIAGTGIYTTGIYTPIYTPIYTSSRVAVADARFGLA